MPLNSSKITSSILLPVSIKAVDIIVKSISNHNSVVLLCLGDTSLFASSANILRIIKNNHPQVFTKIVPGISSISAAAALSNFNLAIKGETLIIKECPSNRQELVDLISINKKNKQQLSNNPYSATFIFGGQIYGETPKIFLIYPEGNFIEASNDEPFLQIGETKYGKPILLRALDQRMSFQESKNKLISNVTAKEISNKEELKTLLIEQIENRVRWRESVNHMINNGVNHFIEIGPGKVLTGLIKRIDKNVKINTINSESDIKDLKL